MMFFSEKKEATKGLEREREQRANTKAGPPASLKDDKFIFSGMVDVAV